MTENEFKEMIVDKTNEWLINKVLKEKVHFMTLPALKKTVNFY
jgi:hypothetical protein